jgi:hypothetical protein
MTNKELQDLLTLKQLHFINDSLWALYHSWETLMILDEKLRTPIFDDFMELSTIVNKAISKHKDTKNTTALNMDLSRKKKK